MGRTLTYLAGGFAIVAITFFVTLRALEYWSAESSTPGGPDSDILITSATYGGACQGAASPAGGTFQIKTGNATAALAKACNDARASCKFIVDVRALGDPAPGCAKDFGFNWQCGSASAERHGSVDPEANGKTAVLTCLAK
jgi:hypothetical protein